MKVRSPVLALATAAALLAGCQTRDMWTTASSPSGPSPTPTLNWPIPGNHPIGFLRVASATAAGSPSAANVQRAHLDARLAHASNRQAPVQPPPLSDIYLLTFGFGNGWDVAEPNQISSAPGPYTSVHVSMDQSTLVYSAVVNGFNQLFVGKAPTIGRMPDAVQITTDLEHHWLPHVSEGGAKIAFTKFDPTSNGDVVCVMQTVGDPAERCLDFGATEPRLRGGNLSHASWSGSDRIYFEAWGGPLPSDEIFSVKLDGTGLTQISQNAGTAYHDEAPSVSPPDPVTGERYLVMAHCNASESCVLEMKALGARHFATDSAIGWGLTGGWDPLSGYYTTVWVTGTKTPQLEIDMGCPMGWCSTGVITKQGSVDCFEIGIPNP